MISLYWCWPPCCFIEKSQEEDNTSLTCAVADDMFSPAKGKLICETALCRNFLNVHRLQCHHKASKGHVIVSVIRNFHLLPSHLVLSASHGLLVKELGLWESTDYDWSVLKQGTDPLTAPRAPWLELPTTPGNCAPSAYKRVFRIGLNVEE